MQANDLIAEILRTLYDVAKPLVVLLFLAFLLLPKAMESNASPHQIGKAFFCYLMQGLGVFLMSVGAIMTLSAVLSSEVYNPQWYLGLLIIFATGGIVFLWMDQQIRTLDSRVRTIPSVIYFFVMKTVGYLSVIFAALACALTVILGGTVLQGWWITPVVLLIYGSILCWLTAEDSYTVAELISGVQRSVQEEGGKKKKKKRRK